MLSFFFFIASWCSLTPLHCVALRSLTACISSLWLHCLSDYRRLDEQLSLPSYGAHSVRSWSLLTLFALYQQPLAALDERLRRRVGRLLSSTFIIL